MRQRVLTALYPGAGQTCAKLSGRLEMPHQTLTQHLYALERDGCAKGADEVNARGGREVHWFSTGESLPEAIASTSVVQRTRALVVVHDASALMEVWSAPAVPRSLAERGYCLGELMVMTEKP